MSIKNQNTHTNKKEVLERLNKLREDVFDYADYNHYTLYDYNVELTLNTLDKVIEAVETPNEKYGVRHIVNRIISNSEETK
tara:strand:+ start:685 stop:927 length:243 start_codon:yes stop_codon:yes gene_type:complete